MSCGIYMIACPLGAYLGSSMQMRKRLREHRGALRREKHHCRRLQDAWNQLGEAGFTFAPIALVHRSRLVDAEQLAIDAAVAAGVCLNERTTAVNSLGRGHGLAVDWSSQPWATATDVEIGRRLGVSTGTVNRHRPSWIKSPAMSREWRRRTGRLGYLAQSIEQLRESARKSAATKRARRTITSEATA